ncbi:uncharacterized protein LOC136083043 [Hydra vulgaris]|uniref:Uncharacterized protein LOC136083043 n=1 Tax=Hydra vulgaris TaxID=6087 RepID=A0ABM4CA54_HYDVU
MLASRGLSFRGSNEIVGSVHNGNYLGCLELVAEFDPLLAEYIQKRANKGRGHVSYLSSTIYDEFIHVLSRDVLNNILTEIKEAKYFAVSVDSTPDISHGPVERFVTFIPIEEEGLATKLLDFMENTGISIKDCRGQSNDNAANMSGRFNGMQAKIKEHNNLAEYHVVLIRLTLLVNVLLPDTRWSAHYDAVHSLQVGYTQVKSTLDIMCQGMSQKPETRFEAARLKFTAFEKEGKDLGTYSYKGESRRKRKRNQRWDYGDSEDLELSPSDKFKDQCFFPIVDQLLVALKQRANAHDTVSKRFGFLKNLQSLSNDGMRDYVSFVCETYFEDVEPNCHGEFIHFTSLFAKLSPPNETDCVELHMYTFLVKNSLTDTFVNVYTVLRIYLSLMVTNCTGERSFSVLKRVKNELRLTMGQPRLDDLALLCIESDIVR